MIILIVTEGVSKILQ